MDSNEFVELELRKIVAILRKRAWIIVLITLIATLTAAVLSYFVMTPIYEASTQLLVNKSDRQENALYNLNDITADLKLTETYSVIIKSPRIIDLVIQKLSLTMTPEELTEKVEVNPVKNSQVISITVTDISQEQAARIANTVVEVFKTEIVSIMKVDNVQILSKAKVEPMPEPVKPKPLLNMAISFVVGIMLSVGLAFLLEYLDTSIRSEEEIEQTLGLPVLGSIPVIAQEDLPNRNAASERKYQPAVLEIAAGSVENEKS
jgi:capsular polysaccharide biosynthesis protein